MDTADGFEKEPKDFELAWISTGFAFFAIFIALGFWFGGAAVGWYVTIVVFAMLVVSWCTPSKLSLGIARLAATFLLALLVALEYISGLPLLVANSLSLSAQALQDGGGNFGGSVNAIWLLIVGAIFIAALFWAVKSYFGKNPARILLSAAILAGVAFPLVGLIAQEAARVIPS